MLRRVPLLSLFAVLVSLVVAPTATAIPNDGILLRGSTTAWVDLYVYVNRTISLADVTMKTSGSYVGFFMSPAPANRDTVGALVMPSVGASGRDSASTLKLGQSWDVRAGKYRMFLITDGPAEVFVPIDGQGFRGWTPRGRAPLSVRDADFDVAAGSDGSFTRIAVPLTARSLVVTAGQASSHSLTAIDELTACVTASASACATRYVTKARVPLDEVWTYGASLEMPGSFDAVLDLSRVVGGDDASSHVEGVVMVLTIGRQT